MNTPVGIFIANTHSDSPCSYCHNPINFTGKHRDTQLLSKVRNLRESNKELQPLINKVVDSLILLRPSKSNLHTTCEKYQQYLVKAFDIARWRGSNLLLKQICTNTTLPTLTGERTLGLSHMILPLPNATNYTRRVCNVNTWTLGYSDLHLYHQLTTTYEFKLQSRCKSQPTSSGIIQVSFMGILGERFAVAHLGYRGGTNCRLD